MSGQHCEGLGQRFLRCSSESALSDSDSKRACAFPMMSRAASVVCNRLFARASSPREPRDLGLFGGEPANLLAGPFARQHPGVALLAPFADQRRIQALPPQIGAAFTVFARLLIGMQMGNLVRRGERATAPRPVGSGVGWIHRFIVVHRGNRGAGHGVPIRISPCVRPICCEPVDSTHPDTQGADQNLLVASVHGAHAPTVSDHTVLNIKSNLEISFNSIQVDRDSLAHFWPPST